MATATAGIFGYASFPVALGEYHSSSGDAVSLPPCAPSFSPNLVNTAKPASPTHMIHHTYGIRNEELIGSITPEKFHKLYL